MMKPYARVIADSISIPGHRLTTMEVSFHRFVLAEFNTHRVFSRNSASSRAIPVAKQIAKVETGAAYPLRWPAEQKGMQGGDELDVSLQVSASAVWSDAARDAVTAAKNLAELGVHKSVVNRVLEPYLMHTVVVTSTAWENFFEQRTSTLAQPEIQAVAILMLEEAYNKSTPEKLSVGEWHTPYVDDTDLIFQQSELGQGIFNTVKVSSARCARVSYETQAGKRDWHEDLKLYDRLVTARPMHGSPLEHVATPDSENYHEVDVTNWLILGPNLTLTLPKYGNLLGWHQHRFDVESFFEPGIHAYR